MNNINGTLYLLDELKNMVGVEQIDMFKDLHDESGNRYMFYPTHSIEPSNDYELMALLREWEIRRDDFEEQEERAKEFVKRIKALFK